eukprot:7976695-Karenia_brevis.AAC.1
MKDAHAYQDDSGSMTNESSMQNLILFNKDASLSSPKEIPKDMPRMRRRITNCNGCGVKLQPTVFYCDLCGK